MHRFHELTQRRGLRYSDAALLTALGFVSLGFVSQLAAWLIASDSRSAELMALSLGQLVGLPLVYALCRRFTPRFMAPGISLRPIPLGCMTLCVALGLSLQLSLSELATWLYQVFPPSAAHQASIAALLSAQSLSERVAVAFCVVLAAPIAEELFFRRLIFAGLRARYRFWPAALFSSLCFAAVHVEPVAVVYALIAGTVLALTLEWTQNLLVSLSIHAATNAAPLVATWAVPGVAPQDLKLGDPAAHLPVHVVGGAVFVGFVALIGIRRWYRVSPPSTEGRAWDTFRS